MELIESFEVDHTILEPGFYISRIDGDITTYDLRFRKPNSANLMNNITMHTIEHLMATILRNDESVKDRIVYFGPMGCQTGFYLLVRNRDADYPGSIPMEAELSGITSNDVYNRVIDALRKIITWKDEVPGKSEVMCGNYRTLELPSAQKECEKYLISLLKDSDTSLVATKTNFDYPKKEEVE